MRHVVFSLSKFLAQLCSVTMTDVRLSWDTRAPFRKRGGLAYMPAIARPQLFTILPHQS